MCVEVRNAAWGEVDAVAADHGRRRRSLDQVPDERVALDACSTEMRLVTLDVVDDSIAGFGRHAAGMLGETENQWKVWPPSITIVWPVTKSEPGPQK
jgi:hypothetical protein